MNDLVLFLKKQRACCEDLERNHFLTNNTCPMTYDGTYCWPTTYSGSTIRSLCPIIGLNGVSVTKRCSNIIREITEDNNVIYEWHPTDKNGCSLEFNYTLNVETSPYMLPTEMYLCIIVCYVMSIFCLITALMIFKLFPHLRDNCRVKIHINLYIALLLQALAWITQTKVFAFYLFVTLAGINTDLRVSEVEAIACKILLIVRKYLEVSCLFWILMESWCFYCVTSRSPYKECTTVKRLIICGWGLPLLVIIAFVIAGLTKATKNFCWADVDAKVIVIPTMIVIVINLCLFVLSVRVLFCKINCSVTKQRKMHFAKWVKSTLMLVPLFGAYHIFFFLGPYISQNEEIKIEYDFFMKILCSLEGLIVTTLYCFVNNEVKSEIKRAWRNWRAKRQIERKYYKNTIRV